MSDARLRGFERAAAAGDPDAVRKLSRARCRAGICPLCGKDPCECPRPALTIGQWELVAHQLNPDTNEITEALRASGAIITQIALEGVWVASLVLPRAGLWHISHSAEIRRVQENLEVSSRLFFNETLRFGLDAPTGPVGAPQILTGSRLIEIDAMGTLFQRISVKVVDP